MAKGESNESPQIPDRRTRGGGGGGGGGQTSLAFFRVHMRKKIKEDTGIR